MKIYEVHYDNGEAWEDGYDYSIGFFASYERAVKYLEDKGTVESDGKWRYPKYVCSKGNIDCEDCALCCTGDHYDGTMFIDKNGHETDWCPEQNMRFESMIDYSWYTIIEHEVIE